MTNGMGDASGPVRAALTPAPHRGGRERRMLPEQDAEYFRW
ncbi:MAG: hypothetical protein AVDCRST_MAG49-1611 [uncultured Thermomicrobiales bacterium]|uniref:Uncharacterized protein n=1 Tax=uncultured Thermomicrobiales bacterium TaxID=1645740 RepID=A0A6J4UF45_9BACT|nr:MAG: hypothetical protein AVDCRST_MAG49-1611 [uncultured Thermomicrobiales bacterium]